MPHFFHIPVMGTCFTTDTPLRVSHLGIDSAISLVDDRLLERIGTFYAKKFDIPYTVYPSVEHARAKRIAEYLNLIHFLSEKNFRRVLAEPFTGNSDKDRYFKMLPTDDPLRKRYLRMLSMPKGEMRSSEAQDLADTMQPGKIDVNIMVKLDRPGFDDAKEALRGYAESELSGNSSLILSAGINQALFSEMEKFPCFYRNADGCFDKKITLKISDFRSALVQGKFLARKGLEVSEYRIESGLNCGGHLFPSDGELLPVILDEFKEKKKLLCTQFQKAVEKYYAEHGLDSTRLKPFTPRFTVQGGIGNFGESERLLKIYEMDGCGWGSPFLLVPEATLVDSETRKLLCEAKSDDILISEASPIGVPFSNLKTCGAEKERLENIRRGVPGAPCIKGFLQNNTEFSERPICTASREYQNQKLRQIENQPISDAEKEREKKAVLEKTCICHKLGNSVLVALGLESSKTAPASICPGPNLAYFHRTFSLEEMVDLIYGRVDSLSSLDRPHLFALEILLYAKWFRSEIEKARDNSDALKKFKLIAENLKSGMEKACEISKSHAFDGENLESIQEAVSEAMPMIENFLGGCSELSG